MPAKNERNAALQAMRKAELIRTIKKLDVRQTTLMNKIAKLERQLAPAPQRDERPKPAVAERRWGIGPFPWETKS